MIHPARTSFLLAAPAAVGLLGWTALGGGEPRTLEATTPPLFVDSDGDMLPDSLEWALLSDPVLRDSDGDGLEDFVEVVQNRAPGTANRPVDHEMRLTVSGVTLSDGSLQVMVNVMIRLADGDFSQLQRFDPYLETEDGRWSIEGLIGTGYIYGTTRVDPVEGTLILFTSVIADAQTLSPLMPMTFGLEGAIGGREFHNGSVLSEVDSVPTALVPLSPNRYTVQPLQQAQIGGTAAPFSEFWSSSRTCELELVMVGSGGGQIITQVEDANCIGAPTLLCAPDCQALAGRVYIVPDGFTFLGGN